MIIVGRDKIVRVQVDVGIPSRPLCCGLRSTCIVLFLSSNYNSIVTIVFLPDAIVVIIGFSSSLLLQKRADTINQVLFLTNTGWYPYSCFPQNLLEGAN